MTIKENTPIVSLVCQQCRESVMLFEYIDDPYGIRSELKKDHHAWMLNDFATEVETFTYNHTLHGLEICMGDGPNKGVSISLGIPQL